MRNPFKKDPDPFSASRYGSMFRSVRTREKRFAFLRKRWVLALIAVWLVVVGIAGYGAWLYYSTQGAIQDKRIKTDPADKDEEPFNALLVGSDSREGLTEEEQLALGANEVGGERADTIILAHIDPDDNLVTMVQFPRDLFVPIAGVGSEDKINSALLGGANRLINTIRDLTGLEVNQYVEVNIAGFRNLVDAIGGVTLCIAEPVPFDRNTGFEVKPEDVGMIKFDGDTALRFVRSRNFPSGDFQRIQNQQKFLSAAIGKVTSSSTILSPTRIQKLADVAKENVEVDAQTTIAGLRDLANRFRTFDPEHYEAYVAPNLGTTTNEAGSVVLPDAATMKFMFEAIKDNESPAEATGVPAIDPTTISVGVYNGVGTVGLADEAAAALEAATMTTEGSVDVVEVGNAPRVGFKRTVIRYDPDVHPEAEQMAELVGAAIPGALIQQRKTPPGIDVGVIVGERFRTKKIVQILPIPLPKPGEPPPECR